MVRRWQDFTLSNARRFYSSMGIPSAVKGLKDQCAFWYLGGGRRSNHELQHTKRFVRYCIYGWGAPAIVVSTFVIIDQLISKGFVGYGEFRLRKDPFNIFAIGNNHKILYCSLPWRPNKLSHYFHIWELRVNRSTRQPTQWSWTYYCAKIAIRRDCQSNSQSLIGKSFVKKTLWNGRGKARRTVRKIGFCFPSVG